MKPGFVSVADLCRRNGVKLADGMVILRQSALPYQQTGSAAAIRTATVREFSRLLLAGRAEKRSTNAERMRKWSKPIDGALASLIEDRVYLIRSGDFVKIGFANNVRVRMRTLQLANPHPIQMIGTIAGGQKKEAELHIKFQRYHHRGEWFRVEGELLLFLKKFDEKPRKNPTPEEYNITETQDGAGV